MLLKRFKLTASMLAIALLLLASTISQAAADTPLPLPVTHEHLTYFDNILAGTADGTAGESTYKSPPNPVCSTSSTDPNANTDCEGNGPHNETTVAINPTNPLNIITSANDYQLKLSSGGAINETTFSRAHVSFDGGHSWTTYAINYNAYTSTGDPAVAFDANGTAYLTTLGFRWSQGNFCCINPDVVAAVSNDGGKNWSHITRIVSGSGVETGPGLFNDKEYVTAWGNGNAIVTWTEFNDGHKGSYISSPIFASVTHDSGNSWSTPTEISGSAPFCIGAQGGNNCDQSTGSTPVMASDGFIYVSFINTENLTNGRDQYLVVKVDPNTGQTVAGPFKVADLIDGFTDYPINIDGRQTYQDSEFRTWSLGNITADPTHSGHLAVVWSDMRNSTLPAPADPYSVKTNSDVVASQSFDGGQTWSAPSVITLSGDQFMPWGAYDSNGLLRIGFFDRSYDPANHAYGYTLATETSSGSLTFSLTQMTNTLSDPTANTRWFSGRTPNPAFPHPTTFLGDYSGITALVSGIGGTWTDMRNNTCFAGRCGSGEDDYFSVLP